MHTPATNYLFVNLILTCEMNVLLRVILFFFFRSGHLETVDFLFYFFYFLIRLENFHYIYNYSLTLTS